MGSVLVTTPQPLVRRSATPLLLGSVIILSLILPFVVQASTRSLLSAKNDIYLAIRH